MATTGLRPPTSQWRICEHCTTRFKARTDWDIFHSPACKASAAKGQIHPARLDFLLADLRRLREVSADARDMTHMWAWRRVLELRGIISMAPKPDQINALTRLVEALLEGSGFAAKGRRLVTEHHAHWRELHDKAAEQIAAGTLKQWPEGLEEYPYAEIPGAT